MPSYVSVRFERDFFKWQKIVVHQPKRDVIGRDFTREACIQSRTVPGSRNIVGCVLGSGGVGEWVWGTAAPGEELVDDVFVLRHFPAAPELVKVVYGPLDGGKEDTRVCEACQKLQAVGCV